MLLHGCILLYLSVVVLGTEECPVNCQANPNKDISPCNKDTGECLEGCKTGFYGKTCNFTCNKHCLNQTCSEHEGVCQCIFGYKFTDIGCEKDEGVICKTRQHCRNNLCTTTAREECLKGCQPGRYGYTCQSQCDSNCLCDQVSGSCTICTSGWYGSRCESPCSPECVAGNCDGKGSCIDGCKVGSYGSRCQWQCSTHCVSGCEQLSGHCLHCEAGWYGSTCQSECSTGCEESNTRCYRNGTCVSGCRQGFYGEKCGSPCPGQCTDKLCDGAGVCRSCNNGFYGDQCDKSCERCIDSLCDIITGYCIEGCRSGFYGETCQHDCSQNCSVPSCQTLSQCQTANSHGAVKDYGPYLISGGVVFVVVILAVLMSFCLKRINSNVIYESVKWRRVLQTDNDELPEATTHRNVVSGYCELDDDEIEIDIPPPRVCQLSAARHESYLHTPDNDMNDGGLGLNVQQQPLHQAEGRMSDLRDDELQGAAAAERVQLSESQVDESVIDFDEQPCPADRAGKTDSYVMPFYCELNEEGIITIHRPADRSSTEATEQSPLGQVQTAGSDRLPLLSNDESQSGNETVDEDIQPSQDMQLVIHVPLLAECSWNTDNSVSAPDQDSPPENYNHPFEDDYVGSKKDDHSDD